MNSRKKFTDLFPKDLAFDIESRVRKGRKIIAVLKDTKGDLSSLTCLDLGCSVGIISQLLGKSFKEVIGMDVDSLALEKARKKNKKRNVRFLLGEENKIPLKDNQVDVVVCNQVYEHVGDPKVLVDEMYRVLKPQGVIFFGARNKYWIFDGHYRIPFVAWLPQFLANFLIKIIFGKEEYDINLYSLVNLRKLVGKFRIQDYTLEIILNPTKFASMDVLPSSLIMNKLLLMVGKVLYFLIPNYIWILKK